MCNPSKPILHDPNAPQPYRFYFKKVEANALVTEFVKSCTHPDIPECPDDKYENCYIASNTIVNFFFVAKYKGSNEWHVFYSNGRLWSSFGKTRKAAIEGAMTNGWLYTNHEVA